MYRLTKRAKIEVAHFLPKHKGKCKQLHGHSLEIEVELTASKLNDDGMVADFGDVKGIIELYDHQCLNEMEPFNSGVDPTSENLARLIAERCAESFDELQCVEVRVTETEGSEIYYTLDC